MRILDCSRLRAKQQCPQCPFREAESVYSVAKHSPSISPLSSLCEKIIKTPKKYGFSIAQHVIT